jgi:hypothetical protein
MSVVGEWITVDKTGWGPGAWQDEPDKIHWVDAATDLDCLMVRQPRLGHWCGYVGVTEGHPLFGKGYDETYREGYDLDIHGGLTFAAACSESTDPSRGICHVALPGRPDHVWWFGFDCAHSGDYVPSMVARERDAGMARMSFELNDIYRDRAYVEAEVRSLAQQLAAVPEPRFTGPKANET